MPKTIDVDQARAEFANVQHVRVETRDGEALADLANQKTEWGTPAFGPALQGMLKGSERVYRLAAWAEEYGPALLAMAKERG